MDAIADPPRRSLALGLERAGFLGLGWPRLTMLIVLIASVLEALTPLRRLTQAGMAVLLLHHPRKESSSAGKAARVVSRSPIMFVSNIGLYSSGVASSIAPMKPKPALLTRTSSLPKASVANATAFSAAPGLVTSSAMVRAVFG